MRSADFFAGAVFAALAFALYAPTIANGTVIDDVPLLHAEVSLRQLAFDSGPPRDLAYYRPITVGSYLILQVFGQGEGQVYAAHVSNLLLYAAAAASVFWLARTVLGDDRAALVGAMAGTLIFVVHPIHTESVAWITARPDVIAGLFMIGALYAYARYRQSGRRAWLAAMALGALGAPLSKEAGASIFILLPLFEWLHVSRRGLPTRHPAAAERRAGASPASARAGSAAPVARDVRVDAVCALALAGAAYFMLRLIVFKGLGSSELELGYLAPAQALGAIGFYGEKLVAPRHLIAFYAEAPTDAASVTVGVTSCVLFGLALALALVRRWSAPAFGLLWIAVTLAPSMPVFVAGPSHAPIAERYLYLPSIGLAVCLGWCISTSINWIEARPRRGTDGIAMWPIAPGSTLILIVAGLLAYMTVTRLHTYSDIETFWATTVQDNPTAGFPRAGLASEYARTGRLHDAAEEFRVAATEGVFEDDDERRALAYDSLGSVYARLNDYAAAVDAYGQAIELFPQSPLIHANLAVAHYNEAHRAQPADGPLLAMALGQARIAVSLDSTSQQNLMVLARIAEGTGELELARETYQRVLRVDASTAEAARAGQALMRLISIDR